MHLRQMDFFLCLVHLNTMVFSILQIHFLTLGSFFSYDPLSEYRLFVFSGVLVIIGLLVFLRFTLCCRSSLRVWFTLGAWGFFTGAVHLIIVVFFFLVVHYFRMGFFRPPVHFSVIGSLREIVHILNLGFFDSLVHFQQIEFFSMPVHFY